MHESLFTPVRFGAFELSSRIVMAPMTRDRAGPDDVPTDLMVEYYRQRASAGLIVTEGVQPSAEGKGYWRTPGIWSQQQVNGWAKVADAVHATLAGGLSDIRMSEPVLDALLDLRAFLFQAVYENERSTAEFGKAAGILSGLWDKVHERPQAFLELRTLEAEGVDAAVFGIGSNLSRARGGRLDSLWQTQCSG